MATPLPTQILVVDDDADSRDLLTEYFAFRGFTVQGAADGVTALALAQVLHPRVILMDLAIPTLDGLETTRRLKANASTTDAIVIAVTAHAFQTDRNQAHRAGCDVFIAKPFDLPALADLVERLIHQSADSPSPLSPTARVQSI